LKTKSLEYWRDVFKLLYFISSGVVFTTSSRTQHRRTTTSFSTNALHRWRQRDREWRHWRRDCLRLHRRPALLGWRHLFRQLRRCKKKQLRTGFKTKSYPQQKSQFFLQIFSCSICLKEEHWILFKGLNWKISSFVEFR
jgi:hypothetical protein